LKSSRWETLRGATLAAIANRDLISFVQGSTTFHHLSSFSAAAAAKQHYCGLFTNY
jgi:hypothetical protein